MATRCSDTLHRVSAAGSSAVTIGLLTDEVDSLAEQRAPELPVRTRNRDPFPEDFAGGSERLTRADPDQFGDPGGGQLHDQTGAFVVDERQELTVDTRAPATHDRAVADARIIRRQSSMRCQNSF